MCTALGCSDIFIVETFGNHRMIYAHIIVLFRTDGHTAWHREPPNCRACSAHHEKEFIDGGTANLSFGDIALSFHDSS
jgi:hypothetical protein